MYTDCTIVDGFKTIVTKINEAIQYRELAGHQILDSEVVHTGISIFLKTGQMASTYKECEEHTAN